MRISNDFTYNYPGFGYSSRIVKSKGGRLRYRTTTYFYRQDLKWDKFVDFLASKYKNADKVHIINYACSTGEETYTLIAQILEKIKDAKKYFPIIAKDIDKKNIKIANSGLLNSENIEMLFMGRMFGKDETDYFKWKTGDGHGLVTIKDNVKNNAVFSVADMLKDIKHNPCKNTVLMCRNVWPYFSCKQQEELIKTISENFVDDTSLLVVGEYDIEEEKIHHSNGGSILNLLKKYGFVNVGPSKYIFQKQAK